MSQAQKQKKLRTSYQVNEQFTSIQGEGVLAGSRASFIRLQGCTVGCWWCDSGPLADLPDFTEMEIKAAVHATQQGINLASDTDMDFDLLERASKKEFPEGDVAYAARVAVAGQYRTTNGRTRNTWAKGGDRVSVKDILARVESHHVVITGGEPTLYDLDGLLQPLYEKRCFTQLETSGQNGLKGNMKPSWITWSPKENLNWNAPYGIKTFADEVKWVLDDVLWKNQDVISDMWEYMIRVREKKLPYFVIMPEGSPPKQENIERCFEILAKVPKYAHMYWRFGPRLQYDLGVR